MKKQTAFIFYLLGIYAVLQFAWWGYHLIELTEELKGSPSVISKKVVMIISEGLVFFVILFIGLWKIRSSIKKELKLSENQNNFLLSVTHELKTPLASNKLYLQTVQKRNLDEATVSELIEKAIKENIRLEALIDNILNASRLENKIVRAYKSNINLSETIDVIINRFHKRFTSEFITKNIQPSVFFDADSLFIESIINNLVENSIKYSDENPHIEVSLRTNENGVLIGIKDQGNGIDFETQKNMFKKFYRSGNEETRSQKGSGLGLFIVAELVNIHKGRISFTENKPTGSIFEIQLLK